MKKVFQTRCEMKEYVRRGSMPSGYSEGIQFRRFLQRRLNFFSSFNGGQPSLLIPQWINCVAT